MVVRYRILCILGISLYSCMLFTSSIDISLLPTADEKFSLVDTSFKERFFLSKLIFTSDIPMAEKELRYLVSLKEQSWITPEDIKRACWHLKRKNKFDTVVITAVDGAQGKELTFALKSAWTFFKVKFKGWLVGKDRYEHYYLLEPGEPFDLAKHQHSLVKVEQELQKNGYLHAKVTDYITYDKDTKRVLVTLHLENTDRFIINDSAVSVKVHEAQCNEECKKVEERVRASLDKLRTNYYSRSLIEHHIQEVRTYLSHRGYLNPKIELTKKIHEKDKTVALSFTITLYQKKRFVFFGNHFYSSEHLLNELLVVGSSALLIPPSLLAEDISTLYKKQGFWQVKVEWKEESERFYFVINEGPRMRVSSVSVKGDTSPATQTLIKRTFTDFLKQPYFDAAALANALDKFGTEHIKQGFWDFKVVKQDFVPLEDMQYELVLTLELGQRRMLTGITIAGYPHLLKEEPFKEWASLQKPRPFDVHLIQEQRQWLLKYFKQRGSLYVAVHPEFVTQKDGTMLVWHIDHAAKVRFGKTVLASTGKIKSDIILRELQYKEGDPWSKEKIDQTIKRLKALNMFESVSLAPYNVATEEGTKTMILKVVEDDPFEIRTRFGFQQMSTSFTNLSGTTYRVGGSFLWKNPCGIADQLRLDADLTRYTRNAAFSYEIPWTCNYPLRSVYQIYTDRYEQPIGGGSKERLYKEAHDGLSVSVTHAYPQGQVSGTVGFELSKLSGLSERLAPVIQFKPQLIDKREPYFYLESSFLWDSFDNKLDPTKGTFTFLSLRGMFPLRIHKGFFVKALLEQSFVYPLYKSIIGALRFRCGHIFNAEFSTILPTERFYLGGATSLRGYETDMVPPLNSFVTSKHERSWLPIGGKSMVNVNAEVRFPLYRWLSGVVFTDMGVLAQNKFADIQAHKWLGATGFGLRCATPIGPIRFDIGWKWKKRDEKDRRYAWFLTLGHAF